jgi:hypothetical protein
MPTVDPRDAELAAALSRALYEEHAAFLDDKDAHDWSELPSNIRATWDNEASKRLGPVVKYLDLQLRTRPEPLAGSGVAGELERLRGALSDAVSAMRDHVDGAPPMHPMRAAIAKAEVTLRAHPAPDQSAHCSGEVVEVVARAIRDVKGGVGFDYMHFCRDAARAALAALGARHD